MKAEPARFLNGLKKRKIKNDSQDFWPELKGVWHCQLLRWEDWEKRFVGGDLKFSFDYVKFDRPGKMSNKFHK